MAGLTADMNARLEKLETTDAEKVRIALEDAPRIVLQRSITRPSKPTPEEITDETENTPAAEIANDVLSRIPKYSK